MPQRPHVERHVRDACLRGDVDGATAALLEGYGPEVYGFLCARLTSEAHAADVFSDFSLDVWRGLAKFEGRSSARVWAYTVAQRAMARHLRSPEQRPERRIPLSQVTEISRLAAAVRTRTQDHMRTENRSALERLRMQLGDEDQTILILRVDRGLSWSELARTMLADDPTEEDITREAGRLRQRYHVTKARLRKMANDAGLLQ